MTDKYVALVLHKWDECKLKGCSIGTFVGMEGDSIGFMPVFKDKNKLIKEYPNSEIIKIEKDK